MNLEESFELKEINTPRITPKKTKNIIIQSLIDGGFSNSDTKKIIDNLTKGGLRYSYKFEHKGHEYLLYEMIKGSVLEYHFFNLSEPYKSAEDIGLLDNSIQVFSMIFNLIYRDIRENKFSKPIRITSPDKDRSNLYKKIFDKVNKKYNLGLVLKDIKKDSFIIDIPRPKNFTEMIK